MSNNLYYNNKTGYVGIDALKRKSERSRKAVEQYLLGQGPYTKYKQAIQKLPTRRVVDHGLDHKFQADLSDIRNLSQYNDNYNYILTVMDVLSKYAWAVPIKCRTGDDVVDAFKSILKERVTKMLKTDHWTESINKETQDLLELHSIELSDTYNR